jgi:hypothetical protein
MVNGMNNHLFENKWMTGLRVEGAEDELAPIFV